MPDSIKSTNHSHESYEPSHVTHGDIFDDLGFSPEEALEAKIKAEIWQALMGHIDKHAMTQAHLAKVLKAHQPDISNLLKGKISKFSITKLIQFAVRLDLIAEIKVRPAGVGSKSSLPAVGRVAKRSVTRQTARIA